jgi:hypothetical protein
MIKPFIQLVGGICLFAAFAGATLAGVVSSFQSGNKLFEYCNNTNISFCLGYIQGITDAMAGSDLVFGYRACIPSELAGRQVIDISVKFMRDHPAGRHAPAASIVAAALTEAYPCQR